MRLDRGWLLVAVPQDLAQRPVNPADCLLGDVYEFGILSHVHRVEDSRERVSDMMVHVGGNLQPLGIRATKPLVMSSHSEREYRRNERRKHVRIKDGPILDAQGHV